MPWRYPTDDRHVPAGGEFLSEVLDNGKPRSLPHSGLDYSHWEGSPIYAIGPGKVVLVGTNPRVGWGYHVWIDHGDIGDGTGRHAYSYCAHKQAEGPALGTTLNGGEQIGTIGATGSGITGAHLHWGVALVKPSELYKVTRMDAASRDYLVDPAGFVAARTSGTAGGDVTPFDPDDGEEKRMDIRVIAHVKDDGTYEEVALICPEVENGYVIAKGGTAVALGWLRTYSPTLNGLPHAKLNRSDYLGAIEAAKSAAAAWHAGRPSSSAGGSLDDSRIVAAITALGERIAALPAEIDRYADGKKNS